MDGGNFSLVDDLRARIRDMRLVNSDLSTQVRIMSDTVSHLRDVIVHREERIAYLEAQLRFAVGDDDVADTETPDPLPPPSR